MSKTYADFVKFRALSNPCIGGIANFLSAAQPGDAKTTQYQVVHHSGGEWSGGVNSAVSSSSPDDDFAASLQPPPPGQGRVIVIEDIHPSLLELLGSNLDIDPIFFADYILTNFEDIELSPSPPSVALPPSRTVSTNDSFHIHYQQMLDLGHENEQPELPRVFQTSGNVRRSVRRLVALRGRPETPSRQLAIVRGCCAVLKKTFGQSWICMPSDGSTRNEATEISDRTQLSS